MGPDLATEYVANINRTAAFELAMAGHLELLKANLSTPVAMLGSDTMAIIGHVAGVPQGVITFCHSAWAVQLDIGIGYVRPASRGAGLYRAMWNHLVLKARDLGCKMIVGNTHVTNERMRTVAAHLGRREVAVVFEFDVPPAAPTAGDLA